MSKIVSIKTYDFRFPTSATLSGSDAMNPDPDYSSAYVEVKTDADDGITGVGFVFTIGRGNDVVCAAIDSMAHNLLGQNTEDLLDNMRRAWDLLVGDSQLRWLGPEKGVSHMAIGALLSALWDIKAKRAGKPLWRLLADMEPEELVATLDFRYLSDALRPEEAIEFLTDGQRGKEERIDNLLRNGYPGYSTAAGWLGYSDEKMVSLCKEETQEKGFKLIKLKVGRNVEDDRARPPESGHGGGVYAARSSVADACFSKVSGAW
ncbi:L-fuconate dehydratase, partial [Actinobaculum suis]